MNTLTQTKNLTSYELIYILKPDLKEEVTLQVIERYEYLLNAAGAKNILVQNRGRRQLAYPIKKFQDGIYIQASFKGSGEIIKTIKKSIKGSNEIIRTIITKNVK